MKKTLQVRKLHTTPATAELAICLMNDEAVAWQPMECANWHDQYPYIPKASFRIAHTGSHLLLHYRVEEEAVRAAAKADGDAVWEDSCCEFFIQDATTGLYNNVECNCAATLLMAVGMQRDGRQLLSAADMSKIGRWTSLGATEKRLIEGEMGDRAWELSLMVPVSLLFDRRIDDISGLSCRANFYKCGDCLPHPHFLSWNPVNIPKPDFHRPDHFGMLMFES